MTDPLKKKLIPIKELQEIRGVKLPARLNFVQLVVTGPPGSGKTYYINKIHGWPNEGYVDLTRKGWWKDQTLTYRPREVHLGFPFRGFNEALTVFDREWLEAEEPLFLELERIQIPPSSNSVFQVDWRTRYVFEFLLPDPKKIYKRRLARHSEGYFPVDKDLTLAMVKRQSDIYREVALYLDQAGMQVYVREGLTKPPMRIAEPGDLNVPTWAEKKSADTNLRSLEGWKDLLFKRENINWFTLTTKEQLISEECRIPHDGMSFEMRIGKHRFILMPEVVIGVKKKNIRKNWQIMRSSDCNDDTIMGFSRILVGDTVLIGQDNKPLDNIFHFTECVAARHLSITNLKGDLILKPLNMITEVGVVRNSELDIRGRLSANRHKALNGIRTIYGGNIDLLNPVEALNTLKATNDILAREPFRVLTETGTPGALLEIPDDLILLICGDLHGRVDHLLKLLSENCLLSHMAANRVALVLLGDAVHSEITGEMENMASSALIMDLICKMKNQFPENFFYLLGNHDSFDAEICKHGQAQGILMRKFLFQERGDEYVQEMQKFYDRLPVIMSTSTCAACHAAPPGKDISREEIIHLRDYPNILKNVLTNRIKRSHYQAGYYKKDIKKFRKSLNLPKRSPVVVGHSPLDPFNSYWKNAGNIKGHHIIYSSHQDGLCVYLKDERDVIPLCYQDEPLLNLINEIP